MLQCKKALSEGLVKTNSHKSFFFSAEPRAEIKLPLQLNSFFIKVSVRFPPFIFIRHEMTCGDEQQLRVSCPDSEAVSRPRRRRVSLPAPQGLLMAPVLRLDRTSDSSSGWSLTRRLLWDKHEKLHENSHFPARTDFSAVMFSVDKLNFVSKQLFISTSSSYNIIIHW